VAVAHLGSDTLRSPGSVHHSAGRHSRGRGLHGPLPFNHLMRSAAVAGARYGLSCLGCSAALMVAMVLLGMSSLWWAVILGIVVLIYKFAPPLRMRYELVLSAALVALGVAYVMMA
jgi:predicted metal-binding membrane protein